MADLSALWPTITDDGGTGQTGTILNKALFDSVRTAIDDQVDSATNPTRKPWHTTDEVVTARGNKTSLNARLAGVIDADGALITPASIITQSQLQSTLASVNLIPNDTFLIWPDGDALAPAHWTLSGAGAAIQRCGTGLADTQRKIGKFCARVTYGAATANLVRTILDAVTFPDADDHLKTRKICAGCWVYADIASHARVTISDGDQTTSATHTGVAGWQWLEVTHTISSAGTSLALWLQVASAGAAYFSGATVIFSDYAPSTWQPAPKALGTVYLKYPGTPAIADNVDRFYFSRPAMVKNVIGYAKTAPGGGPVRIDLEHPTGAWTSMFAGGSSDIVGVGVNFGQDQPDGTYQCKCFTNLGTNNGFRLNFDLLNAAEDILIQIVCLQYTNPLEDFLAFDD